MRLMLMWYFILGYATLDKLSAKIESFLGSREKDGVN